MRTYGRITNPDGSRTWQVVTTDANGWNDAVYLTTVAQVLQLGLAESPVYSNYGIPAVQSVATQIPPDIYAALTQQQFAPFFAALSISREPGSDPPTYQVDPVCHGNAILPPPNEVPT